VNKPEIGVVRGASRLAKYVIGIVAGETSPIALGCHPTQDGSFNSLPLQVRVQLGGGVGADQLNVCRLTLSGGRVLLPVV
jgi:hypothetical protein